MDLDEQTNQERCDADTTAKSYYKQKKDYKVKKSVSFKTLVEIFQLSDVWQLRVKKCDLKTEEDQVLVCRNALLNEPLLLLSMRF